MKNPVCVWSVTAAIAAGIGPHASAGFSQSTITSPAGFIQAGAYNEVSGGGAFIQGADLTLSYSTWRDFHEQAFSSTGSAQASATYSNGTVVNSAIGSAAMGIIRAAASDSFPCNTAFSAGMVNGGWKETFTINHPALDGQTGFLVFQVRARGRLAAQGFNGAASLSTTGYKDNQELLVNPLFDRGNSDAISTIHQRASWAVASDFSTEDRPVDGTVTMAVPITFGQSFTLGVYAWAVSGQRSQAFAPCFSSSSLDFSGEGVAWAGITSVQSGGQPVSGYTVISATGIDWTNPYTPPPICGSADFNHDGDVGTDADIEAFFACLAGNCCATCGTADFNGDGDVGTDADIESFFRVLGGGPC